MIPELRKVVTFDEDIHSEGGRASEPVLRMIGVAAVVKNPWAGKGFVEDLKKLCSGSEMKNEDKLCFLSVILAEFYQNKQQNKELFKEFQLFASQRSGG